MADFMTRNQRSRAMAAVRGSETEIERTLRTYLHRKGFRFRKNVRELPGCPDIVLPKYGCIIFVHGCFWHHHKNCRRSKLPSTHREFWTAKIATNVERDRNQVRSLRSMGWRVLTIWECALRNPAEKERAVEKLIKKLTKGSKGGN
jgi:DNA mismatch endonuclease (patch repair protein)